MKKLAAEKEKRNKAKLNQMKELESEIMQQLDGEDRRRKEEEVCRCFTEQSWFSDSKYQVLYQNYIIIIISLQTNFVVPISSKKDSKEKETERKQKKEQELWLKKRVRTYMNNQFEIT